MLPVVMSQIEGLQRDEDSRIEPSLPEGSTYPSWKALLTETVVSLSDDTEVDDQWVSSILAQSETKWPRSIVSEPSNEFSNRLAVCKTTWPILGADYTIGITRCANWGEKRDEPCPRWYSRSANRRCCGSWWLPWKVCTSPWSRE